MRRDTMLRSSLLTGIALIAASCIGDTNAHRTISQQSLLEQIRSGAGPVVLDVRSPEEYRMGHVPGAINIPHRQVGARLDELSAARDRGLVVYCEGGPRTEYAESVLRQAGFEDVYHLEGDIAGWRMSRLPMER